MTVVVETCASLIQYVPYAVLVTSSACCLTLLQRMTSHALSVMDTFGARCCESAIAAWLHKVGRCS